ncbi:nucleotidyltransferase domain-containing protein [Cellulomonas telluris]|uniref:nucleotidyltransferase domain-containing protein n=1 Tax=Cellulomonas telluris TaxID=2306636 RepID=UPI001FE88E44|nr:nucleotidyltransferase domain-containing protein [Cellulomonas telluris]
MPPGVASRRHDLPVGFDPQVVAAVDARLHGVAAEHGVHVPWAIESGSRAWGFPSPDSDYDCRFFFVRPLDAYLDPWPARDVIETPLDAVLDVNGWDLVKAVRLAVAGNATVGEWLRSPHVYAGDVRFRDELLALVDDVTDRDRVVRHYLSVGTDHWQRSGAATGTPVPLKKVLYAVRPAAVLHWFDAHPGATPPMELSRLLAEAPVPAHVQVHVDELVAAKSRTRELGTGVVPARLRDWVEERFRAVDVTAATTRSDERRRARAADGFRALLRRWAP